MGMHLEFARTLAALAMGAVAFSTGCEGPREQTETFLGTTQECIDLSWWPVEETSLEDALHESLNLRRADPVGCDRAMTSPRVSLSHTPSLRCAARMSARDMGTRGHLSPIDSAGRDTVGRVADAGGNQLLVLGEARARDLDSVVAVLDAWMDDADTCALLQDASAREVGVATWSESANDPLYWAVVLASPTR